MTGNQCELEEKAYRLREDPRFGTSATVEEVFGPYEDWILLIGSFQLLLVPFNLQWCVFDNVHGTWENSGYKAGEVLFSERDGRLIFHETPSGSRDRAGNHPDGIPRSPGPADKPLTKMISNLFCPACNSRLTHGKKFCGSCGTPITPPMPENPPLVCTSCGHPLTPGKKFCGGCGRNI